jgi:hypothetical protein
VAVTLPPKASIAVRPVSPYAPGDLLQRTLSTGHVDKDHVVVQDTLVACAPAGYEPVDRVVTDRRTGLRPGGRHSTGGAQQCFCRFLRASLSAIRAVDSTWVICIYPQVLGKTFDFQEALVVSRLVCVRERDQRRRGADRDWSSTPKGPRRSEIDEGLKVWLGRAASSVRPCPPDGGNACRPGHRGWRPPGQPPRRRPRPGLRPWSPVRC